MESDSRRDQPDGGVIGTRGVTEVEVAPANRVSGSCRRVPWRPDGPHEARPGGAGRLQSGLTGAVTRGAAAGGPGTGGQRPDTAGF